MAKMSSLKIYVAYFYQRNTYEERMKSNDIAFQNIFLPLINLYSITSGFTYDNNLKDNFMLFQNLAQ